MRLKHPALFSSLLLVAIAHASPSSARDVRTDLIEKIADIVAIVRLCPALEMDMVSVTTVSRGSRIGERQGDYDAIETLASARQGEILRAGATEAACREGESRYGPGGIALPGMLRLR